MMPPVDKKIVARQFSKNKLSYPKEAIVQAILAKKLSNLAANFTPFNLSKVLEIGCGTGLFTKEIIQQKRVTHYILNDLSPCMHREVLKLTKEKYHKCFSFLGGDAECIAFPENIQAIFSNACIHWFDDINRFFAKVFRSLKQNGFFAFSTFGPNNFIEIKTTFEVSLNYASLNKLIDMLKTNNFKILHSEEWTETLRFKNTMAILKHLKNIGVTGFTNKVWTPQKLLFYVKKFEEINKKAVLTYHPLILIAKKP